MISRSLPRFLTVALLASKCAVAKPAPALSAQAGFSFNELVARWDCPGTPCGYSSQLCCTAGKQCYTDSNDEAQCGTAPTPGPTGGHWEYYTTTYVETDLATVTTVMSTYVSGGASSASPTAAMQCNQALNEVACGDICCASYQYCYALGSCVAAGNGGGNSPYNTPTPGPGAVTGSPNTGSAGAPIRPTSSSLLYITSTQSAVTTTVPFETPVATGANITFTQDNMSGGSGLSGGAIAGIVIGVLVAVGLLALLLFCCCIKGLLDGLLAIFGLGSRKKKRTEVVEEYERRSHHSRSGGRTWYGAAKPSRVSRKEERKSHEGRELLGIGAGLAALWAVLGLKRRHDQRRREERQQSEYSYNSSYDYTSESSASSDDRRTRQSYHTRTSRR